MTPQEVFLAITGLLMSTAVFALIIWDCIRLFQKKETISGWMYAMGKEHPIIPFLFGIISGIIIGLLAGHWWWPVAGK